MSLRSDIKNNLAARLATITSANGYLTNVVKIFSQKIPTALSLEAHEVPAIIIIPGLDEVDPKGQNRIFNSWAMSLWCVLGDVEDDLIIDFVADVAKAIFANSATADRQNEYRTIHPAIYKMDIVNIEPDLNMIEANRVAIIDVKIMYTTKYNEL